MQSTHIRAWAGIAVLLLVVLACNPSASSTSQGLDPQLGRIQTLAAQTSAAGGDFRFATAPSPEPTVSASGRLGQRIAAQTIALTATQVEMSEGTGDSKPEQGQVFVIIHLNVENLDSTTGLEVDNGDFQLRDAAGDTVDSFPGDVTSDQIQDLDLGPSEQATGTIVFQVPTAAHDLHLLYDFNEKHIDIDLGQ